MFAALWGDLRLGEEHLRRHEAGHEARQRLQHLRGSHGYTPPPAVVFDNCCLDFSNDKNVQIHTKLSLLTAIQVYRVCLTYRGGVSLCGIC